LALASITVIITGYS